MPLIPDPAKSPTRLGLSESYLDGKIVPICSRCNGNAPASLTSGHWRFSPVLDLRRWSRCQRRRWTYQPKPSILQDVDLREGVCDLCYSPRGVEPPPGSPMGLLRIGPTIGICEAAQRSQVAGSVHTNGPSPQPVLVEETGLEPTTTCFWKGVRRGILYG